MISLTATLSFAALASWTLGLIMSAVIVLSADPTLAAVCRSERHAPALLVRYGGQRWRVLRGRPPAGAVALVAACSQAA